MDKHIQEDPMFTRTKGTNVAITGCTDGIGKALTHEFAKRGYGTYLLARNFEKLDDMKDELKTINPTVDSSYHKIDFSTAGI